MPTNFPELPKKLQVPAEKLDLFLNMLCNTDREKMLFMAGWCWGESLNGRQTKRDIWRKKLVILIHDILEIQNG